MVVVVVVVGGTVVVVVVGGTNSKTMMLTAVATSHQVSSSGSRSATVPSRSGLSVFHCAGFDGHQSPRRERQLRRFEFDANNVRHLSKTDPNPNRGAVRQQQSGLWILLSYLALETEGRVWLDEPGIKDRQTHRSQCGLGLFRASNR